MGHLDPAVKQLKEAREERGLPRVRVADMAGISRSTLTKYELGKFQPPLDVVRRWARALGLDIPQLERLEDNPE